MNERKKTEACYDEGIVCLQMYPMILFLISYKQWKRNPNRKAYILCMEAIDGMISNLRRFKTPKKE